MSQSSVLHIVGVALVATMASTSSASEVPSWTVVTPENTVTYVVAQPGVMPGSIAQPAGLRDDPDLEPGFPVEVPHCSGSYHAGQALHTLVMNLDDDPELEIVATALATGPVYAWNHDGSLVPGWPLGHSSAGYPAGGPLVAGGNPGVVIGYWDGQMATYDAAGTMQSGWPLSAANYIATPPSVSYVGAGAESQIFIEEEDWNLHAYAFDGGVLPGWPVPGEGGQERHTCAIGDIDGEGPLEIVTCSGATSPGVYLFAYHPDGSLVLGFPVNIEPQGSGAADAFPVLGEVDGDPGLEIVVANKHNEVRVYAGDGTLEATIPYEGTVFYSTAVALGDLDSDGLAEIVVQTNEWLNVLRGDGTAYPGWPVHLGSPLWMGNSSPVIGDVDGDGDQDIVVTVQQAGSGTQGEVHAYDSDGSMLAAFPKPLPMGAGGVPAIADFDLDGRNEIIVTGCYWDGTTGDHPKVWAFDLQGETYGGIEWGQFMHDEGHTGNYFGDPWVSVVGEGGLADALQTGAIRVSPNPARVGSRITLGGPVEQGSPIMVYSAGGRLVRVLDSDHDLIWEGRDQNGNQVPPGAYFVRSGISSGRAIVIR
jgi:hypothetical protein